MTIRRKELLTAIAALAVALGLYLWGDALGDWMQQSELLHGVRSKQLQSEFDSEMVDAYYIQESTGLRLANPGAKFFNIRFNSRGFRGPELIEEAGSKVIRIAYVGDSITLDKQSFPDEKSWAALTTEKLATAFPGCTFTYQNTGISGMSSRQAVRYYKEVLKRFKPDITIVMTDDRFVTIDELAQQMGLQDGPADEFRFTRQQLLAHYEKDLPELLQTIQQHGAIPVLLSFGQRLQEHQSTDEQARRVRVTRGRMPYMSIENFLRSASWYNEVNREIAAAFDIAFIEWHNRVPGARKYYYDFRHFTPTGSALLAGVLVDEMQRSPILSTELSERFGCGTQVAG